MSATKPTRLTNFDNGTYRSLDVAFQAIPGQPGYYFMSCYQHGGWSTMGVLEEKSVKNFFAGGETEKVQVYSFSDDPLEGVYRGVPEQKQKKTSTDTKAPVRRLTKRQMKVLRNLVDHDLSSNEDIDSPVLAKALDILEDVLKDTKAKGFTLVPWYGEKE